MSLSISGWTWNEGGEGRAQEILTIRVSITRGGYIEEGHVRSGSLSVLVFPFDLRSVLQGPKYGVDPGCRSPTTDTRTGRILYTTRDNTGRILYTTGDGTGRILYVINLTEEARLRSGHHDLFKVVCPETAGVYPCRRDMVQIDSEGEGRQTGLRSQTDMGR